MSVVTMLVAVAVAVIFLKWRTARLQTERGKPRWGAWHCVSVRPSRPACAAVLRFRNFRFLPAEAPIFPLSECDVSRCDCRYEHHADRRRGQRRRDDAEVSRGLYTGPERRSANPGRRASDRR